MKTRIHIGRIIYLLLAIGLTLCILIQIYLAGMAVFINPANWSKHTMFGHIFLLIFPIFMLIFAFIGSFPRWAYWHVFGFFVATFLMYFSVNIAFVLPWVTPLHPVFAFLYLVLSSLTTIKTWNLIRQEKQKRA